MMVSKGYIRYIYLFIIISFAAANILFVSSSIFFYELAFAQKNDKDDKDFY